MRKGGTPFCFFLLLFRRETLCGELCPRDVSFFDVTSTMRFFRFEYLFPSVQSIDRVLQAQPDRKEEEVTDAP